MLKLSTPNTGYPDLELKIAYGLARLALETFPTAEIKIRRLHGFYEIEIHIPEYETNSFETKIEKAFQTIKARRISYKPLMQTPGFQSGTVKSIMKNTLMEATLNPSNYLNPVLFKSNSEGDVCGHDNKKIGAVIGLTTCTSYHHSRNLIDKAPKDKKIQRPTNPKKICITCALLAILGEWYSALIFKVSNSTAIRHVVALPLPKAGTPVSKGELHQIFALQHLVKNVNISNPDLTLSEISIPLILFSQYPSLASVLENFDMLVSIITRRSRSFKVESFVHVPLASYIKFIENSPFNVSVVKTMNRKAASKSLQELAEVLRFANLSSLLKFVRNFTLETSYDNYTNLLPLKTAAYLLGEVGKMKESEIFSPEIQSMAKTMRYFVMNKQYYYADEIRNAKDYKHLMEILGKMLREARKEKEKTDLVHIPTEEEVIRLINASQADENFKKIKLALYVLAFAMPCSRKES